MVQVLELFKEYQDMILSNAKKSERDFIKDIFAKTELFDVSRIKEYVPQLIPVERNGEMISPIPKEITLPFESCFIEIWNDEDEINGVFIREYSPEILTGAAYCFYKKENIKTTTPFTIRLDTLELIIKTKDVENLIYETAKEMSVSMSEITAYDKMLLRQLNPVRFSDIGRMIQIGANVLDSLNKREVITDHASRPEYYTFKDKNKKTVKIENRPIYYILNKGTKTHGIKTITHLEYSHAFNVIGHWRKLNGKNKGLNRQGQRVVEGHTWIKPFVKGQGELVQRVRIVK